MGVPLLLLLVTDHLSLLAFAAFGGFTSLYARNEPYRSKAKLLAVTAVTLVLAVAAGTSVAAFSDSFVAASLVVALVAGLTKLVSDAVRTGPPAGLMPTFACAVCAELPLQPHDVGTAVAVAAAAAAWSWLVCMSGWLVRPHGPERVAVARALEATAARSASVGTDAETRARHGAAVAIQRAWQAVGAGPQRPAGAPCWRRWSPTPRRRCATPGRPATPAAGRPRAPRRSCASSPRGCVVRSASRRCR